MPKLDNAMACGQGKDLTSQGWVMAGLPLQSPGASLRDRCPLYSEKAPRSQKSVRGTMVHPNGVDAAVLALQQTGTASGRCRMQFCQLSSIAAQHCMAALVSAQLVWCWSQGYP